MCSRDDVIIGQGDIEEKNSMRSIHEYGSLEIENLFNHQPTRRQFLLDMLNVKWNERAVIVSPSVSMSPESDTLAQSESSVGIFNSSSSCWLSCIVQLLIRVPQLESVLLNFTSMEYLNYALQYNKKNLKHAELLYTIVGTFRELKSARSTSRPIEVIALLQVLEKMSASPIIDHQQDVCELFTTISQWLEIAIDDAMDYHVNHENNHSEEERQLYINQKKMFDRIFPSFRHNDSLGVTVNAQVGNFRASVEHFFEHFTSNSVDMVFVQFDRAMEDRTKSNERMEFPKSFQPKFPKVSNQKVSNQSFQKFRTKKFPTQPNANSSCYYKLTGLIVHVGSSAKEGHFYSFVLQNESSRWSKFDDDRVSNVRWEDVAAQSFGTGSSKTASACLLVYAKMDGDYDDMSDDMMVIRRNPQSTPAVSIMEEPVIDDFALDPNFGIGCPPKCDVVGNENDTISTHSLPRFQRFRRRRFLGGFFKKRKLIRKTEAKTIVPWSDAKVQK
ncbi:ubiquitinyl hydrolase 1 [Caenorhabditis elegans]|uniref:ubiquitinyl hydrolase 1 n=2 Tax=Caenorhabditis elegans TaxID=6239 RepID=H2KYU7_CAEEL|nr:ubiquitinyl hydrolase 1 [Caenorhabditis elegans]CCD64972.1 ubiquitinyl hydrolase 1 [Caenorhabditis elegans]|eukprot:NP_495095.2 Uncharacterized protein CELE_F59E12.6 [Caenorhabditis elegans]